MMFNDKNLWRNRGFLAHGMKENQKTYWKDELSLLLSEAPSVTSRYREIVTKTDKGVLFCLNRECDFDEFIKALFWADITIEEDEDNIQYLIDLNKSLVVYDFGLFYNDINALFESIKGYGGFFPVDYYSDEKSEEIFKGLELERNC